MPVDQPPVAIEAQAPVTAAWSIFENVCLEGSAALDRNKVSRVDFRKLPAGAKAVLRFALPPGPDNSPGMKPPRSSEAMRIIYRIEGEDETYLMLPDGGGATSFANVCAVVTKGDSFTFARNLIIEMDFATPGLPGQIPYISTRANGFLRSAAQQDGWTIASTVPCCGTQEEKE